MTEETPTPAQSAKDRAAAAAAAAPKPRRSAWWMALNMLVQFLVLLVLASWCARWSWVFDLTSHFRLQYAVLLSLSAVVLLIGRWFKWGLLVAVLAGTQIWSLAPFYLAASDVPRAEARQRIELAAAELAATNQDDLPTGNPPASGSGLEPLPGREANWVRVMSVNVHTSNTDYRRLLELVKHERPDILFIMECDNAWIEALAGLPADYIYREEAPRSHNFGVAIYSRYPVFADILELGGEEFPVVVANVTTPVGRLTVIGAHTIPPMQAETAQFRNEQLEYLARLVESQRLPAAPGSQPPPLVVIGDWNITSWSPHFADLIASTNLRDTRRRQGLQPTWPTMLPPPLRIPIDHALVSPEIKVLDRRLGPAIGSDHLPIILDLLLPAAPPAATGAATLEDDTSFEDTRLPFD